MNTNNVFANLYLSAQSQSNSFHISTFYKISFPKNFLVNIMMCDDVMLLLLSKSAICVCFGENNAERKIYNFPFHQTQQTFYEIQTKEW